MVSAGRQRVPRRSGRPQGQGPSKQLLTKRVHYTKTPKKSSEKGKFFSIYENCTGKGGTVCAAPPEEYP
jgi:hypothetical protein